MNDERPSQRFDPVRNRVEEFFSTLKYLYRRYIKKTVDALERKFSKSEFALLFESTPNPESGMRTLLFFVGVLLTPVTLLGALLGYIRGFDKFMRPFDMAPVFFPLKPIVKIAMVLGAVLIWVFIVVVILITVSFVDIDDREFLMFLLYLGINLVLSLCVFLVFYRWRNGIIHGMHESRKFGTARFSKPHELAPYQPQSGLYIGNGHVLPMQERGHILTVAGTRSGKGTNLIIPNLLGISDYQGSWVVIDPKGENAAITARYQRESGRDVVILNPWDLLGDYIGPSRAYNPMDILSDTTSPHLVDDAAMIAEMLVPVVKSDKDSFFSDNARSIVTGIIMYIACHADKEERTLATLWRYARYREEDWLGLIASMQLSDHPENGLVIRNIGYEIQKLSMAGEETFGSIISTVLQATDFLKSPSLQRNLQSDYDPAELAKGNTALYVIIPADKLQTYYKWLRLVTTTTMRAVVRKPENRVTFILDEFAALGYLPEVETALSTYAGYQVTVWPILQSLVQLKNLYHDNWETFTANATVKQFFGINDNFSAEYISAAIGETTHMTRKTLFGKNQNEEQGNSRKLVTPDEVRRGSASHIFAFLGNLPVTLFEKIPYYEMPDIVRNRAGNNPYYK